jgi:membrane associated rhomboid family serine protease
MGIYDRDYYRQEPGGFSLRRPQTVIGTLILVNVVVFLVDGLFFEENHAITNALAVKVGTLTNPLYWWQFLTYGFAHAPPPTYWHIVGNMLVLFFLGRDIESRYGAKEFLRLYLAMLVVAGVAWAVVELFKDPGDPWAVSAVGASGAVTGVVILYALNFPRRTLLLFFVIPMPAWVVGLLVVISDVFGALNSETQIAYTAHLGGMAFAFLYFRFQWNLSRWTDRLTSGVWPKRRPNLRVHNPDRGKGADANLSDEVDRILEKISRQGESSLTRKERRTLEDASRQYQKKRNGPED